MQSVLDSADDTIRVLFIEDDPAVAEMYKLKLELDGYLVTIASLSAEIGEIVEVARPELIFLDTQRDQETGLTTLRALREATGTQAVPVIILSSQHPTGLEASGFKANVLNYIVQADTTLNSLSRDIEQWSMAPRAGLSA